MSASSHRPFPCLCHGNENLWDGMGGILTTTGFPPPHCVPCAMCQPRGSSRILRGAFCDPRAGGCRTTNPNPWGSLRGPAPSCTRRRVPPSRRRGATLSRGEPTVVHCRRALFSVGKRGVRYPFVPKAGRCRRRWVSSTQSFESRSARVPR